MIKTYIIAGFTGTGKSQACSFLKDTYKVADMDPAAWHNAPGVWPDNYIAQIKQMVGEYHFIFVSSHSEVLSGLDEAGVAFNLVYPQPALKEEYCARFIERNENSNYIAKVSANWLSWIDLLNDYTPKKSGMTRMQLGSGESITNIVSSQTYIAECLIPANEPYKSKWVNFIQNSKRYKGL